MNRTRATPLIGIAVLAGVVGFLLEYWATSTGLALIVPPLTLPLTLIVVSALLLGFAIPIRRAVTGAATHRIDPFRATRVVVLAKACSLVGALLTGLSAGALIFFLTRSVLPDVGSMWLATASCLGAVVLGVAGLVAEHLCTLPKDEDPDNDDTSHSDDA
ncbi:hypothetical protein GCM10027416_00390 [Okibacterium endophyticum]